MYIICLDMEGVFVPEIWINVAEKTGIEELRLTTRDISDYDILMKRRLNILREHNITLKDITDVIASMDPLEGALEYLDWLRSRMPVIIVSDTYVEFAGPLMKKLRWPALFCHHLSTDDKGLISSYHLRQKDGKRKTVIALKSLNYKIIGVGDSYNDITMLKEADTGILFKPPENVKDEYPEFPVTYTYEELKKIISEKW